MRGSSKTVIVMTTKAGAVGINRCKCKGEACEDVGCELLMVRLASGEPLRLHSVLLAYLIVGVEG